MNLFCPRFANMKPRLHRNANKTRMRQAKMMRTFDVDVFLRRGKQSLVKWWGEVNIKEYRYFWAESAE